MIFHHNMILVIISVKQRASVTYKEFAAVLHLITNGLQIGCKNACFISKNPHDNQAIGIIF